MIENATKNLREISLEDVKTLIKEKNPVFFDKMIISSSEIVHRTNFFYLNYSAEVLNRQSKLIEFPLFGSVKDNFSDFQGGTSKHGEKKQVGTTYIFSELSSVYKISPSDDSNAKIDELDYPITVNGNRISTNQELYFLPERTFSWICKTCNGSKYVKCKDNECNGRHEWDCTSCYAKGTITCNKCAGNGKISCDRCSGSGKRTCSNCGGDGKVNDGAMSSVARSVQGGKEKNKFFKEKKCGECSGKGQKTCEKCNKGSVTCSKCQANGKVVCPKCEGNKSIICSKCYGDKARYGLVDCHECKAMGEMAKVSFVETKIEVKNIQRIFFDTNSIKNLNPESLLVYADKSSAQVNILRNFNDVYEKNYHNLVENTLEKIHGEFKFNYKGFKSRVTNEELYFQIIPCVQIEYRHMLTNTIHKATILNFFENPELVLEKEIEENKPTANEAINSIGNFFGKLFKTKKYRLKEDKKREIRLMIMLAKIDGKIEEEEKLFLSSQISNLNEFTKAEKIDFFTLIDSKSLPPLTKNDVVFYFEEKYNETLQKLDSLSQKDGESHVSEIELINNIKTLRDQYTKKKKESK
jgi:hypothetical protein